MKAVTFLTIIFSILRVPHFGLGGIFVWGAFMAYFAVTLWGLNFAAAIIFSAASMALLGALIEKLAFKRLRAATGLLEVQKRFRRIRGYKALVTLVQAIKKNVNYLEEVA